MQIVKILKSINIRFGNAELGTDYYLPDLIAGIRERYRFFDYPTKAADISGDGSAKFQIGRFENININKLDLYSAGISIEAEAPTEQLDAMMDDLFVWAQSNFPMKFIYADPVSRLYSSSLEFRDESMFKLTDALQRATDYISECLSADGVSAVYALNTITLVADPKLSSPLQPVRFSIERRANTDFEDNVFFSEAPLSTEKHISILKNLSGLV